MTSSEERVRGGKPSRNAGRRRDAAHNRQLLLAAARRRLGCGGTFSARDLARDAGLSVATLYRHFPTRDDLLTAVFTTQTGVCEASLRRAAADPDPANGLRGYLADVFAVQAADPGFTTAFRRAVPPTEEQRRQFHDELTSLVDRAREAGVVRADLSPSDVLLILAANNGVTATRGDRAARSRRLTTIVLEGMGLSG
jgi:AcrR family transcriptional regulator